MAKQEVEEVIERLSRAADGTEACATVDGWARDGRVADLVTLAEAFLAGRGGDAREAVLDHLTQQLAASSGETGVDGLVGLAARANAPGRTRAIASHLGFASGVEAYGAALARHAGEKGTTEELLACWMHELVLRGTPLAEVPAARAFHEKLARAGHPLGTLPLTLLGSEREATSYLPMYGERGLETAVKSLERGSMSMRTLPPPAEHTAPTIGTVADAALEARLVEAVRAWSRTEAKVFSLEPKVASAAVGKWLLRALPLACLEGESRLQANRTGPEEAFGALFAAAANGGARDPGLGGAYGRRAAWTTLAALVGAGPDTSPADVDARARTCGFVMFRAEGAWFYDVAWDVGVLAVRADGASAAVVAATDTD